MPGAFCAVNSCTQRRGGGLPFFRCPKEEARCQLWRTQLGFTGDHRYANISTEQCYERIKICRLHFTDDSFVNESKDRLNYNAIPTLFLSRMTTNDQNDFCGIDNNEVLTELHSGSAQTQTAHTDVYTPRYADTKTQTENSTDGKVSKKCSETQTDAVIKIDECSQTTQKLSCNTPRKVALKKRISSLEREATQTRKRLLTAINLEDVEKFLEDNYPAKSAAFLKAQLFLLNKAPRGFTKRRRKNIDSYEDDSTSDSSKPIEMRIDDSGASRHLQCQSDENMSDSDSLIDIIKHEIDIPEDVPDSVTSQELETVMINDDDDDSQSTHNIEEIRMKEEPSKQNDFDDRHPIDVFCKSVALSLKSLRMDLCNEGKIRIMQLISELEQRNSLPSEGPSTSKSSNNYAEPTSTVTKYLVPKKEFD